MEKFRDIMKGEHPVDYGSEKCIWKKRNDAPPLPLMPEIRKTPDGESETILKADKTTYADWLSMAKSGVSDVEAFKNSLITSNLNGNQKSMVLAKIK